MRRHRNDDEIQKQRARFARRIVRGCARRCFTCQRHVTHRGACSGVRPRDPDATPICHVSYATGEPYWPLGLQ